MNRIDAIALGTAAPLLCLAAGLLVKEFSKPPQPTAAWFQGFVSSDPGASSAAFAEVADAIESHRLNSTRSAVIETAYRLDPYADRVTRDALECRLDVLIENGNIKGTGRRGHVALWRKIASGLREVK
jgi:hypothetical protein